MLQLLASNLMEEGKVDPNSEDPCSWNSTRFSNKHPTLFMDWSMLNSKMLSILDSILHLMISSSLKLTRVGYLRNLPFCLLLLVLRLVSTAKIVRKNILVKVSVFLPVLMISIKLIMLMEQRDVDIVRLNMAILLVMLKMGAHVFQDWFWELMDSVHFLILKL